MFAAAVVHKLADLPAFRIVLHDYQVLPLALVTPATAIVIAAEAALAATLPWPATSAAAARVAVALLALYTAGIAINLLRGRRTLECGCAPSTYRQPLSAGLIVRNVLLMAAAAALLLPASVRALAWLDGVTFLGVVVAAASAWTATQRLLALEPRLEVLRGTT
jgi:hypothetical protein